MYPKKPTGFFLGVRTRVSEPWTKPHSYSIAAACIEIMLLSHIWRMRLTGCFCVQHSSAAERSWYRLTAAAAAAAVSEVSGNLAGIVRCRRTDADVWMAQQVNTQSQRPYRVDRKLTPFWYLNFLPVSDAVYLQYSFSHVSFSFNFIIKNCNFVTMVVLTNDERCLIQNQRAEKHWGCERTMKTFSDKWVHLNCE